MRGPSSERRERDAFYEGSACDTAAAGPLRKWRVIAVRCVVSETWGSQLLSNQDSAASDMR
jgi:hypothetical protein